MSAGNQIRILSVDDHPLMREGIAAMIRNQADMLLVAIRSEFVEARVMVLTTFEGDVEIQRALKAGARGYMLKSKPPGELLQGIREVHAGKRWIPPELFITEETVKVHVKHIMEKLGAKDRTEAVAIALRRGIIQL